MARSRHLNEIELRYNYVRNPRYYATRIQAFVRRLLEEAELRFRVSMVHFYTARSINQIPLNQRFPRMQRRADRDDERIHWWRENQPSLTLFQQMWNAYIVS